jgi:adenylate kinase
MNVILIGPPGVGKGTQAPAIERATGLKHIASGDLFRQHMRDATALGTLAQSYVHRGELVPDEIVIRMILDRISQPDCTHGVLFDGFPRTLDQATALDRALADHDQQIDAVIFLSAPREVLLKRVAGRMTCRDCQTPYNRFFHPPTVDGVCDHCTGELYTRSDDNLETAQHRLDVYFDQTMPLINHFDQRGMLHKIDGLGSEREVMERLLDVFNLERAPVFQPRLERVRVR